ncbi:hypothetical protein NMY22_g3799 [Coprinellus aureogranulatus]|nr:hypothetical protein NMY22_g3799 [Coprinellus aureogranulatus]
MMTLHDPHSLGLAYLVSGSGEFSDGGTKASLVLFGLSASISLDCFFSLIGLFLHDKRHTDADDPGAGPAPRLSARMLAKRLQLLVMCLLFICGLVFTVADSWASNRTAVRKALNPTESAEGWILRESTSSVVRTGVAAFWISTWLGTGFMIYRTYLVLTGVAQRLPAMIFLALVQLASVVTGAISLSQTSPSSRKSSYKLTIVALSLAAATYTFTTACISFRLHLYRRRNRTHYSSDLKGTSVVWLALIVAYDALIIGVEGSVLVGKATIPGRRSNPGTLPSVDWVPHLQNDSGQPEKKRERKHHSWVPDGKQQYSPRYVPHGSRFFQDLRRLF